MSMVEVCIPVSIAVYAADPIINIIHDDKIGFAGTE